ncbi:serine hydrolase domain-containing protein [Bradyrhizobium sp.]|jgi:CubicO group peptidase (beta-lactamase class C family)|uniref:serine hydrolase domain-containing protein n=1 Tax=Bradyrhizobium sp. TaxID=376 RepID=UPI003C1E573C
MKYRANPNVDRIFSRWNKPNSPGFALAVSKAGKIVYSRGYGMADLDHKIPITPGTVFHACSLAKQFTAMCIMLLEGKGKLSLGDKVGDYVPELGELGSHITIADMLHHISGIRDQWVLVTMAGWRMSDDVVTLGDVLYFVNRMKTLNFHPRSGYSYSNTNYTLAGLIVERVSHKYLSDFARKHIFAPLGMKSTTITNTHGQIMENRAYGYRAAGKAFEIRMPNYDLTGATNLLTTVEDLVRWNHNFDSHVVGGKKALATMQEPVAKSNNYGLGLMRGDYKGLGLVEHDGRDAGYRSHLIRFPEQQLAIALLGNVLLVDVETADIVREVADVYLPRKRAAARQASAKTSAAVSAETSAVAPEYAAPKGFVGRYYSEEIDTVYEVALDRSSLRIERKKNLPSPLIPIAADTFGLDDFSNVLTSATVKFSRDAHGKIDGFRIDDARPAPENQLLNFRFTRL